MELYSALLDAWRNADARARAAEDALLTSTLQAVSDATQLPPLRQLEHAKQLRSAANELLRQAIAELRPERDTTRPRPASP